MKQKHSRKILSVLLTLVMLLSMIPASALTAHAETTKIMTVGVGGIEVPQAGNWAHGYDTLNLSVPSGVNYELVNMWTEWYDDTGRCINNNSTFYKFESGRSYTLHINLSANDGYEFAESNDFSAYLIGIDRSLYTTEVQYPSSGIIQVGYKFEISGERTYDDIERLRFYNINTAAPKEKTRAYTMAEDMAYTNAIISDEYWEDAYGNRMSSEDTFAADSEYSYHYILTACEGYQFVDKENLVVWNDNRDLNCELTLTDGNTKLYIKIPYYVSSAGIIDQISVNAGITRPVSRGIPKDVYDSDDMSVPDGANYKVVGAYYSWRKGEEEYGNQEPIECFEAGQKYTIVINFSADDGYIFTNPANITASLIGFDPSEYTAKVYADGLSSVVRVGFTFTAEFPEGAGQSVNKPAICYGYNDFKYAMEHPNITYVALGRVEDMLPTLPHDEEEDPGGVLTSPIIVRGNKDLNLFGNAVFTHPLSREYDVKCHETLLTLAANTKLYVHGSGSLTFNGSNLYFYNSAIHVAGGSLTVDGATIIGSHGNHKGYCYGINALCGNVSITGGATIRGGVYKGEGISALSVGDEGTNHSLSISIWDGKFYVDRTVEDGKEDYGMSVHNDCGLRIYGGSFDGIELGSYTAGNLSEYIVDGRVVTANGNKIDPASEGTIAGEIVEVYEEISDVNIHVNAPVAGEAPTIYTKNIYLVPEGCTADSITWYEDNSLLNTSAGDVRFEAGKSYKVEIVITSEGGGKFANPLSSATINYKNAEVSAYGGNINKGIVMTVDFGECPATVPNVDLTVTAPKEGATPSYSIGCGSDAYYAVGGSSNYTDYRQWYMSSNNDDWQEMEPSSKFQSGYYYKFYVDIRTDNGYEFPLYDNGSSILPNVSATVNGHYAKVIKAYEQDPSRYITVEYDFGECNDSVIEEVKIVNVKEPVAGEYPTYTASVLGTGYHINTSKESFYDDWQHNRKLYYIKNGVGWFDLTESDWVYENETFIPGHEYQVNVFLQTSDDYSFYHNKWYEMLFTATVNGMEATSNIGGSSGVHEQKILCPFICETQEVSTLMIYELAQPKGGAVPDTEVTMAYPNLYKLADWDGVTWWIGGEEPLGPNDSFISGESYSVVLKIVPVQMGGANVCEFIEPMDVRINGAELSWLDRVTVTPDLVEIEYKFRSPAAAPELSGVTVSGDVTSFGSDEEDVTVQLIREGEDAPSYQTIVEAGNTTYTIEGVAPGAYTLRIIKADHVARDYEIIVAGQNVEQDAKICLKGDVNLNGSVDYGDLQRLYQHLSTNNKLVDYGLEIANVNTDANVNYGDLQRLYQHLSTANKLF